MTLVLYGGLVLLIAAGLIAGLDYLREGHEVDRVRRLGEADNAARTPVRREPAVREDWERLVVNPDLEEYYRRRLESILPGEPLCYWCWPPAGDPDAKKALVTDCVCPDWCDAAACIAGVRHG